MNKDELKKLLASSSGTMEDKNKALQNRLLRDIRFYQNELRQSQVKANFSARLSDLTPELAAATIGIHGHTRSDYQLQWLESQGIYAFVLQNIKANKQKLLTDCPVEILKDMVQLLPLFIEKMAAHLQRELNQALAEGKIDVTEEDNESEEELAKQFDE